MKGEVSGERPKIPSPPTESKPSLKRLAENSRKAAGKAAEAVEAADKIGKTINCEQRITSKGVEILKQNADEIAKISKSPPPPTPPTPETSTSAESDLRRTIRSTDDPRGKQIKQQSDYFKH